MTHSHQITLSDGRKLGYLTLGPETGRPIIYNHGWPSSRLEASIWADAVARVNGRIFAEHIPQATAHFIEGEDHVSLVINHGEAILADLLA